MGSTRAICQRRKDLILLEESANPGMIAMRKRTNSSSTTGGENCLQTKLGFRESSATNLDDKWTHPQGLNGQPARCLR